MEINQMNLLPSTAAEGSAKVLSRQQRQQVQQTLQQYDCNDLSAEQAKEIVRQFQQQSIHPGRELAQLITRSGFDASTLAQLAGLAQRPNDKNDNSQAQTNFTRGGSLINRLEQLISYLEQADISEQQSEQAFSQVRELFYHSKTHGLTDTQAQASRGSI
ncbi:MAG: hypothetical protein OFPI_08510 [Osedax symbiont Rs2]|nr:MAG: hypothetical protein OFPI_08510 [Osedax symbiont Rs2]